MANILAAIGTHPRQHTTGENTSPRIHTNTLTCGTGSLDCPTFAGVPVNKYPLRTQQCLACRLSKSKRGLVCQKQISKAGIRNYIPQYMWGVKWQAIFAHALDTSLWHRINTGNLVSWNEVLNFNLVPIRWQGHFNTYSITNMLLRNKLREISNLFTLIFVVISYCSISYTWWRHQMETFSALLAICAGNSPVTGEFPAQRSVTLSFDVFVDLRLNKRLSKQSWGWWFEMSSHPLWHHCNVYWSWLLHWSSTTDPSGSFESTIPTKHNNTVSILMRCFVYRALSTIFSCVNISCNC